MAKIKKEKANLNSEVLEIKKTPQGFLIEKNGKTIELNDNETDFLKKALVHSINERDFEFLQKLLPGSFNTEPIYNYENNKLKGNKIVFICDFPELSLKVKSILQNNTAIKARYLKYNDKNIFDKNADIVVAHQSLPRKSFFLKLNQFCLDNNIKFIKTTFDNHKFIITPFMLPYESACYNCYSLLKSHNHVFDHDTLEPKDFIHISHSKPNELMIQFFAHFLIIALFKYLTADRFFKEDLSEMIFDLMRFEISKNPLLKVPFCPACNSQSNNKKNVRSI